MKKAWRGFTLIEVSLFLAVTAALFIGIAAGTQNSIFQQRYSDAVQNFAEYLRSIYSQVSNVQNENTGRSDKAIYGKVLVFSEENGDNKIKSYNLVGDVTRKDVSEVRAISDNNRCSTENGEVINKLCALNASVVLQDDDGKTHAVGFVDEYVPRWASQIQTDGGWGSDPSSGGYDVFQGILLITHSPSSGNIYTYVMRDEAKTREIADAIDRCEESGCKDDTNVFKTYLRGGDGFFKTEDVDFCINPNGAEQSRLRRDIRLSEGAHNASSVEVMIDERDEEGLYNRCAL